MIQNRNKFTVEDSFSVSVSGSWSTEMGMSSVEASMGPLVTVMSRDPASGGPVGSMLTGMASLENTGCLLSI